MSEDKPKRKKQYPKLCTKCNIEKPPSGWTEKTYNDSNSTICNKCIKKPIPKSQDKEKIKQKTSEKKSKLWNNKDSLDMKRSMIYEEGYPLAVPFCLLDNQDAVDIVMKVLESNQKILVTLFRETVEQSIEDNLLKNVKTMMDKITLQFVVDVSNRFPGFNVSLLDWPKIYRSGHDIKRSTHPFISHRCRAAVIVSKDGEITDEQPFSELLFRAVHDEVILKSQNKWVILGDETGSLNEFDNKNEERTSTMCWIAIPPGTNLKPLHPEFHCSSASGIEDYTIAIKNLAQKKEILYFSFAFEEGMIPKRMDKIGRDPHLSFWKETLPLVLEKVSDVNDVKTSVDIFVEQVGPLESGTGVLQPIVSSLATKFMHRKNWANLNFDQMWVISKGEHPWIGYSDAIGHTVNKTKTKYLKPKDMKSNQDLFDKIHKSPFRQESLNGAISNLHGSISQSKIFLELLHNIEANDLRDYVRPFFSNAIKESIESLTTDEWDDLLEHIDIHSRDKKGQRATALIHDFIDIDEVLAKLDGNPTIQFDLLRMMLGTSNHRGSMSEGIKCKNICEEMLESGFQPTPEKLQKFQNLIPGLHDNMFDFTFNLDQIPTYSSSMSTPEIHTLGTKAQSFGLTGDIEHVELAIQIEENLASHGDDRRHKARHALLHAELLLQIDKIVDAKEILEKIPPDSQNSFLFATMLKCFTLGELKIPNQESFTKDMVKLLDDDHPSQRIAYWYARWALQNGLEDEECAKMCIDHLLELREVPLFSHDAPGVILSCELMDLESRGYEFDFDTYTFFERVKSNSQPTTLEWLENHPPNEENWLAPLNFNYC